MREFVVGAGEGRLYGVHGSLREGLGEGESVVPGAVGAWIGRGALERQLLSPPHQVGEGEGHGASGRIVPHLYTHLSSQVLLLDVQPHANVLQPSPSVQNHVHLEDNLSITNCGVP